MLECGIVAEYAEGGPFVQDTFLQRDIANYEKVQKPLAGIVKFGSGSKHGTIEARKVRILEPRMFA